MILQMHANNIIIDPESQDDHLLIHVIDNNADTSKNKDANKIFGALNVHFLRFLGLGVDGTLNFDAEVRHIKKPFFTLKAINKKSHGRTVRTNISVTLRIAQRIAKRLHANNVPNLVLESAIKNLTK